MAGYTRQDTANNIANGNVIDADDFDAEYNAVEAAFNASTGHKHDGTAGEGAPIEKVGPSQEFLVDSTAAYPKNNNLVDLGKTLLRFKDGYFGSTVYAEDVSVNDDVTIGGDLTVTGNATISGNLTFGDAATDTIDFQADVDSDIKPETTGTYNLGSSTQQWNNLWLDGTANVDTLTVDENGTVAGTFDVTGAVGIDGDFDINTNKFTVASASGNTAIAGTLDVTGVTNFNDTTTATSTTTGAVIVDGGVGIAENLHVGGTLDVTGAITGDVTGDLTGNADTATALETARTIAGNSFDGTANITIAATDLSDTNQALSTTSDVTFNDVVVSGDLTVSGTTTTVNTETINLADNVIVLNSNYAGSSPTEDGGIEVERGTLTNKSLIWDESEDKWSVGSETFVAGTFEGALTGNVTGNVTGDVTGNADTATALATARTIAGQSFDGTANISIAPTDLTSVTATAAEINVLDGITATTAELNYTDGVTSNIQTQLDAKAALAGASFTGAVDVDAALTANSFALDNGTDDWTFEVSSNKLIIKYSGTAKMELDTSGNLKVTGDVTAYGTIS